MRCYRLSHLVEDLSRAHALQHRSRFLKQIARVELLSIDDFGLAPLADQTVRDLLDILDARYQRGSTLITSQLPIEQWHAHLRDPTLADAILARLIHHAHVSCSGANRCASTTAKRQPRAQTPTSGIDSRNQSEDRLPDPPHAARHAVESSA